ncbi:MAG TPA: hypothetical protein VLQ68_11700, partial [Rhizobiaceae bacterium]|nr:hypothetical protein [Rhizobiaceae bacterium]
MVDPGGGVRRRGYLSFEFLSSEKPTMGIQQGDLLHTVAPDDIAPARKSLGRLLVFGTGAVLAAMILLQALHDNGYVTFGFDGWRPILYAYIVWGAALCAAQVMVRGEQGKRALFVLPAVLFVISMVVFPLIFGLLISFSNWNLSSLSGRQFNGLDNVYQMMGDPFYWNALRNMVLYVAAVIIEYAIAFGLALLLNSQIVARKFFRVVFLL